MDKGETQLISHSMTDLSAEYSSSVSVTYRFTWNINNMDLMTDQCPILTKEFPETENCDRFYFQMVKQTEGNTPSLKLSVFKCGKVDRKLSGGLLIKHRPEVTVYGDDEEVEADFNDESDVILEMSDEWRRKYIKEGLLRVGCLVRQPKPEVDLNLGSMSDIISQRQVGSNLWDYRTNSSELAVLSKEGFRNNAHKSILQARSPTFKGLLKSHMNQIWVSYGQDTTEGMLRHIYTGQCDPKYLTVEMMAAADEFKLSDLKLKVESHLAKTVNKDNALSYLKKAISHNACLLHQACVRHIVSNNLTQAITQSAEWQDMDDILKIDLATRLFHT